MNDLRASSGRRVHLPGQRQFKQRPFPQPAKAGPALAILQPFVALIKSATRESVGPVENCLAGPFCATRVILIRAKIETPCVFPPMSLCARHSWQNVEQNHHHIFTSWRAPSSYCARIAVRECFWVVAAIRMFITDRSVRIRSVGQTQHRPNLLCRLSSPDKHFFFDDGHCSSSDRFPSRTGSSFSQLRADRAKPVIRKHREPLSSPRMAFSDVRDENIRFDAGVNRTACSATVTVNLSLCEFLWSVGER